jgi:hypothetical protein
MHDLKYIGGNFSYSDMELFRIEDSTELDVYFPDRINSRRRYFFETGSDAIAAIYKQIESSKNVFWFPDNFCEESISRIKQKTGVEKVCKYRDISDIKETDGCTSIVILVHYNKLEEKVQNEISRLKKNESFVVLEDFVHTPLEIQNFTGDYAFNSLRKIVYADVAVAYLLNTPETFIRNDLYYNLKRKASEAKQNFQVTGSRNDEEKFIELYHAAEKQLENEKIQPAHKDNISALASISLTKIKAARAANYKLLEKIVQTNTQIQILPGNYFFLMAMCEQRDELRKFLFSKRISAPIHWRDSHSELSRTVISFPIDQRYDKHDMMRLGKTINEFYSI